MGRLLNVVSWLPSPALNQRRRRPNGPGQGKQQGRRALCSSANTAPAEERESTAYFNKLARERVFHSGRHSPDSAGELSVVPSRVA